MLQNTAIRRHHDCHHHHRYYYYTPYLCYTERLSTPCKGFLHHQKLAWLAGSQKHQHILKCCEDFVAPIVLLEQLCHSLKGVENARCHACSAVAFLIPTPEGDYINSRFPKSERKRILSPKLSSESARANTTERRRARSSKNLPTHTHKQEKKTNRQNTIT